ncbi:type III-B CRISPR module RAMP protein Cmr6 [Archaeoglobus fulgidus]|uniref:type III-B CRISPR module RAMP protein Cmr6 n=1 Tax=Archaeoglobus fulgidus TaxID=2234 RepID=UPI000B362045|nr:type III-B CRISPR module RAMP protein Cmr6 [Archaeoglobus fulgidus]
MKSNVVVKYPVNSELANYAEKFWKKELAIYNLSLILNKMTPFVKRRSESYKSSLSAVKEIFKNVDDFQDFLNSVLRRSLDEYRVFFENYERLFNSFSSKIFSMRTKSRLVVGLGDESVYETSIRLHRNYGVPYIPGSALKGVAKHYAFSILARENGDEILRIYESVKEDLKARIAKRDKIKKNDVPEDYYLTAAVIQELFEKKFDELGAIRNTRVEIGDTVISVGDIVKIFGTQKEEGSVIFFDAFPTPEQLKDKPNLELDIMNPHYQPYYQHGEPPGDWHSPNPIFFLTVPAGVEFTFAVASRDLDDLAEKAEKLLKEALKKFGVGAKTSLGYGRFDARDDR